VPRLLSARIELKRAARVRDGLVGAAREPAYFTEIGAKGRHRECEFDRIAQLLYRIAEIAGLVGDHPQEMDRVGLVRPFRRNAVAERLRLRKPAGSPMLPRERQRR
jgi:hypothetical protein